MTIDPTSTIEYVAVLLYAVIAMFLVLSVACGVRVRR